ncbi:MAG TPA: M28 family peptidase, partial [Myxococcaceae bacterium]|nr:M28 family peptidase [Myxococcaceae bacterium]
MKTLSVIATLIGTAALGAGQITPAEKKAAGTITPDVLRAHIRFLASDLLEGRFPATRGDQLAEEYVASQLEALGVKPGGPNGSWFQSFSVVGLNGHPDTMTISKGAEKLELKTLQDFIASAGKQNPESRLENAEIVFVGYGIVAPEYQWDDYKGADLKGKVLLMMNNDPDWDPNLFAGKTRLWYGRWDYKYESAAKTGAAGAIIIHTTPSAGYPWQVVQTSWSGEQFSLPYEGGPRLEVRGWATEDASKRIAAMAGKDLAALIESAKNRNFRPVPLGVTASTAFHNEVSKKQTENVIGVLKGSDPKLSQQVVIYTAHHDHLGIKKGAKPGEDSTYNGARDNASGVSALLAIARAYAALPAPPRRTIMFSAVAAEEQGLLGSEYLAKHPPIPPGNFAANINMDAM